jgi:hypothetical protein
MPSYLIIGGTTKAATTALFAHFARHPRVSPARLKEPRFFLDPDYPLDGAVPFARGLAAYEALFPPRPEPAVRLEATPDYLHSPGTARRIRGTLPAARLVFSLRDPIERLLSWYRFARGAARLPRGMTLEEYVERQRHGAGGEQPFRALSQGRYAEDLQRFLEELGPERVCVLFHEELVRAPGAAVRAVARFAGLDPAPLSGVAFEVRNPTRAVRSPRLHRRYVRLAFHVRNWSAARPRLFAALGRAHRALQPLYWGVNARMEPAPVLGAELRERLTEYYAPSVARLAALLGRRPPWEGYGPAPAEVRHGP